MFDLAALQWLLTVLTALVGFLYFWLLNRFQYWSKRGISTLPPSFPFGNCGPMIFGKESFGMSLERTYEACKDTGQFAGYYITGSRSLVVLDPEMVKNVMVKDFQHFHDRGVFHNEKHDPLSANLFALEGEKWKVLRAKLTPTFTSGKMKDMHRTMTACADELRDYMSATVSGGGESALEIKDILARFTTDIIGSCALGIQCNSLKDPKAEFREIGKKVFVMNIVQNLKMVFALNFMDLARKIGIKSTHDDVTKFFMSTVRDTIKYRKENNVSRNDFMQLMMQLMDDKSEDGKAGCSLTCDEIAAQAFIFFVAGFETSSSAMSHCLYEMALNPEIQDRVRQDINQTLEKHGGVPTYEALNEMHYLDKAISETLRKYPTLPVLNRECVKDYTLPGTNTVIPRGTPIFIPVGGLHHDPDIYPEPDRFDPERFNEENRAKRHHFAYLPFGEGPRVCIGMRFGMMQTRLGLITIIRDYKIERCTRTVVPLQLDPKSFLTSSLGGIWLRFEPIAK